MTEHVMTFPTRSWARIENRAENFGLDGIEYISSAIKLGSLIVEKYWQNLELGEPTVICLHEEEADETHWIYRIEEDWNSASKTEDNGTTETVESDMEEPPDDSGLDADDFLESEVLLREALPEYVEIFLGGVDIDRTVFFAAALNTSMVNYIAWCIKMRCRYDISQNNGFAMIMNDAANNTAVQIHLV